MKKIQLSMLILSLVLFMTSSRCSNTQSNAQPEADSVQVEQPQVLAFDSVEYHFSNADSTQTCNILIDAPQGNDSVSLAIKRFLSNELAALSLPDPRDPEKPKNVYQGKLDNPQTFVDFYGKMGTELFQENLKNVHYDGDEGLFVTYEASIRKVNETSKYLTFQSLSYVHLGGAHGYTTLYATNVIKSSGKVLTQTVDTTKVNALQSILRKGVVSYLKGNGETVTEKDVIHHLFIETDIIPLPAAAPYLAEDGVHFVYGQYEIGPFSFGIVEFTVPYAEIKPYLTPEALQLVE